MDSSFVVDASAVVKTFVADQRHMDAMTEWLHTQRMEGAQLLAPPLLRYELGQVLRKSVIDGQPSAQERQEILGHALLGFRFGDPRDVEAHAPPLSFYDAAYLALARSTGSALVTYDALLADEAAACGIEVVVPGA